MNEESLQELKEWHENDGELHQFQIENLIETAERFSAIQKENAILSIMLRDAQFESFDTKRQNKRYRETLENIRSVKDEDFNPYAYMMIEIIDWADVALRGESE